MMDEFYCPTSASGRSLRCNFRSKAPKTPPPPKMEPMKFPKMPKIHIPPMPEPQPIAPPPTATSAEVAQGEEQARRDLNKRKGLKKTVLAGETGGYKPNLGGGTILGGPTGNA